MGDLISVIVPVYNVNNYLSKCVLSICNQTYKNIQIILVDDGSYDGSEVLCDELAATDSRITVIHQHNQGNTAARNTGLAIAKGKYIGFVDSDDWIETNMYEVLYNNLLTSKAQVAVCRHYYDRGDIIQKESDRSIVSGIYDKEDGVIEHNLIYSDDFSLRGISPALWDKLFERDIILKHQAKVNVNTILAEDDICVYSALLDAGKVVLINEFLYHYCRRNESITQKKDELYFEKITLFYTQMKKVFESHKEKDLLISKLNRYMIRYIIRGMNVNFGFPYGVVVPFFLPPYKYMIDNDIRKIILYGAGDVGMDYHRSLIVNGAFEIVAWVDKRWREFEDSGYCIQNPKDIRSVSDYDAILIATDNNDLSDKIKQYLINELGVHPQKVIYEKPELFINTLDEKK
ncbi:MAG: glycosyltransferase [Lachnospiraceae bacterium]|nr:glycosyltransferase [Lachnospiraceae bacterium]